MSKYPGKTAAKKLGFCVFRTDIDDKPAINLGKIKEIEEPNEGSYPTFSAKIHMACYTSQVRLDDPKCLTAKWHADPSSRKIMSLHENVLAYTALTQGKKLPAKVQATVRERVWPDSHVP